MLGLLLYLSMEFSPIRAKYFIKDALQEVVYCSPYIGNVDYFCIIAQEEFAKQCGYGGPDLSGLAANTYKERESATKRLRELSLNRLYSISYWGLRHKEGEVITRTECLLDDYLCSLCDGTGLCQNPHAQYSDSPRCEYCTISLNCGFVTKYRHFHAYVCRKCLGRGTHAFYLIYPSDEVF